MNNCCSITLGRLITRRRWNMGLSQRELASRLQSIDFITLSKIENDRLNVKSLDYDNVMDSFAQIFSIDRQYLEVIRQQTEVSQR